MRRFAVILASLAAAGVVAGVWNASARVATCPTTMRYDGVTYTVHYVSEEVGANMLGVGTERGCGDDGSWTAEVTVVRVPGVDPREALATPVAAGVLYVAKGVTVDELPSRLAELRGEVVGSRP